MRAAAVTVATLALVAVVTAIAFKVFRRYAVRVEHADQPVADRLHRLQRATLAGFGVNVLMDLLLLIGAQALLAAGRHAHRASGHQHPSGARQATVLAAVLIGPWVALAPLLAIARAVRPTYARLRDVPRRVPGAQRRAILSAVASAVLVTLFQLANAVIPRDGAGHVLGILLGYALLLLVAQTLMAPLWLFALRARPLPPIQRARLQALASRLGVKVRDIRAYPASAQRQANAVQIGLLPSLRYVLVSDYLLDHLSEEEVDAVVAHELGHARGRHLLIKLSAVLPVWALFQGLLTAGDTFSGHHHVSAGLLLLPLLFAIPISLIVVQGLVGVRLEERADDAAAEAVGASALASALRRIGELNHVKADTGRGWALLTQHPGLAARLARLERRQAGRFPQPPPAAPTTSFP